jgi:anti-sigma regulatory factor (Ser/Thr protein kinase)
LQAAVIMGEVRQAVRAAAVEPKACDSVLEHANTIVNLRPDGIIVTALFGIYDPRTARISYATAGHPPPVMALEDGTAYILPAAGIPLGVEDRIGSRDWHFTLPPSALFVVYTDGLTEHSRDALAGEDEMIVAVRRQSVASGGSPASGIVEDIFAGRRNVDDVAVLVLAAKDEPAATFNFEFPAVAIGAPLVRHTIARYAERQGVSKEQRFDLLTAVGEAVANAVEHAYATDVPGAVQVRAEVRSGDFVVTVSDSGRWRAPRHHQDRGRGLAIMRALCDRVQVRAGRGETTVHLALNRRAAG